jgi:uncharacterized protein YjbI with pentapeptide repeats
MGKESSIKSEIEHLEKLAKNTEIITIDLIEHLEKLAKNTEIITIDLKNVADAELLRRYIARDKKHVDLSFNKFLEDHKGIKGKVVVAEITGGFIGYNKGDPYSGITVDGADFTGCRFKDIEFHSMKNVSFRDSVFDKVHIMEGEFANIDFRGSELSKCRFFSNTGIHALTNIQLAFANPDKVQDKGVFVIEDDLAIARAISRIDAKIEKEKSNQIIGYLEKQNVGQAAKQGFFGRIFVGQIDPQAWGKGLKKSDLSEKQQENISSIEAKWEKARTQAIKEAELKHFIRFKSPTCDPTYTPNQTAERAAAVKVPFDATKEDLENYAEVLKGNDKLSFNDFIARSERYSEEFAKVKQENPGKMVVAIATFAAKTDLSNMELFGDLSGVNFSYCKMNNCILNDANLNGSCLEGCKLKGAKFERANLMDCNMIGVTADKNTSFKDANMIRARVNASDLKGANLDGAVGYMANFQDSDMEGASMVRANLESSNLRRVNLRDVDARYANMRKADLSNAVADHAKLMHANLTDAVANGFSAQKADLEHAVMDRMEAHFANFRAANLKHAKAKGANLSNANLQEVNAANADFENAILREADAAFANFEGAILKDVKAQKANFKKAVLENVKAERMDVSGAVLDEANLQGANLTDAVMKDISARKADFRKACLLRANLQGAALVAADLREADLRDADVRAAVLMAANLEKAKVDGLKFDERTVFIDANLDSLIGDDEIVKALWQQKSAQEALKKQWGGRSKYGSCSRNEDGSNDRFKCQRLGALVLSAALAGGAGATLAGPLAGLPAAAIASLISDKALVAAKNTYFEGLGYVNNELGDRLAEVGAVAFSMGVGTAEGAINGGVAGLVCSFAGVVNGAAFSAVGVGATLAGMNLVLKGIKQESRWRRIAGKVLCGVGAVTAFFGFSSLGTSISTVAYATALGGIAGGVWAAKTSITRLSEYKEQNGRKIAGARPEEIYNESINKAKGIWEKIVPTMRKILIGAALSVGAAVVANAIVTSLPLLGVANLVTTANVAITAAAAGFFTGYLYDNKIAAVATKLNPFKKVSKSKEVEPMQNLSGAPLKESAVAQEPSVQQAEVRKFASREARARNFLRKALRKKKRGTFAEDIRESESLEHQDKSKK